MLGLALLVGCSPEIGDDCETALDCSASGSRLCDRTQRGGYCTIQGCEEGTCPEESVCVKFRPGTERNAITYCMRTCEEHGDCRDDEGYRCLRAEGFGLPALADEAADDAAMVAPDAVILGNPKQRFCALPPSVLSTTRPDMSEEPDAGPFMSLMPDDDAGL